MIDILAHGCDQWSPTSEAGAGYGLTEEEIAIVEGRQRVEDGQTETEQPPHRLSVYPIGRLSPVGPVYAFRLRLWRKDQRWREDKGETGKPIR